MNNQARIRQFIIENFYIRDPSEISDDALLVTTGIIDSTGMLEVIAFLEEQFGIRVSDEETTPDHLESIARMASFVDRKKGGNQRAG